MRMTLAHAIILLPTAADAGAGDSAVATFIPGVGALVEGPTSPTFHDTHGSPLHVQSPLIFINVPVHLAKHTFLY
jgi:hypothetical protein